MSATEALRAMSTLHVKPQDGNQTNPRSPFEQIKRIDPDGNEFWSARDLMPLLEYASWQKFSNVLIKAQIACENSGRDPSEHFIQAVKMINIGHDAKREVEDAHLSRYACYL